MTALNGVNGTVCNEQQYQQSLQSHDNHSPSISCLAHGEYIGLAFAAEASSLSCICVITILIWIGWNIRWYKKAFPRGKWKLFQKPADIYMFALFVFELFVATGGMINIRWAHDGIVTTGPYCTAQGLFEQTGDVGVALISLLLAVHTFVGAVLQVGLKARGLALSLVCLACVFIMLWVGIGAGTHWDDNYEIPTPYWCWISPQFLEERLAGDYVWMWIALFASAILYIPLYFWAEGYWSIDEGYKFHWRYADRRVGYAQRRATLGILLYPLGYSIVVLPISMARWLQFSNHHVSSAATFFAATTYYLSGAINVTLFLIVRPRLLLFPRPNELDGQKREGTSTSRRTGPVISPDTEKFQHSPEAASATLEDGGSRDSATPSHVKS